MPDCAQFSTELLSVCCHTVSVWKVCRMRVATGVSSVWQSHHNKSVVHFHFAKCSNRRSLCKRSSCIESIKSVKLFVGFKKNPYICIRIREWKMHDLQWLILFVVLKQVSNYGIHIFPFSNRYTCRNRYSVEFLGYAQRRQRSPAARHSRLTIIKQYNLYYN